MLYLLFLSNESFYVRRLIKFKIIPLFVIIACFFSAIAAKCQLRPRETTTTFFHPLKYLLHKNIWDWNLEFHPIFTLTKKLKKALTCKSCWIVNGSSKLSKAFWKTCQIRSQKQCRMAKLWEPFKGSRHMVILIFWKTKTKQNTNKQITGCFGGNSVVSISRKGKINLLVSTGQTGTSRITFASCILTPLLPHIQDRQP